MQKRLIQTLLFVAMVLISWITQAQTLGEYTFSTGTDTTKWVDMSSATQILSPVSSGSDSRASSVRNIGFSFPFGANSYTQYSVNTDGNMRLGATATGTRNYATPFSSSNANINNPKINFFGNNGYFVSGSHYVKALNTVDNNSDSMLCVEYCAGTYSTSTRNELYRWQVHLYPNGNIEVVYGPAPGTPPDMSRQPGLCVNSTDGWYVDATHTPHHFTSGISLGIGYGNWPTPGRYYRFAAPTVSCAKPTELFVSNSDSYSFDLSWNDTSSATSWIVRVTGNDSVWFDSVVTAYPVSVTGLHPATYYTVQVAGVCQVGDTSDFCNTTLWTPCAILTELPYIQTFDQVEGTTNTSVATNNLPPCWWYNNTGSSSLYSGYPIVYRSSSYAHSGTNSMRFYTYYQTGTYGDQTAILPLTDSVLLPLSGLQLTFWMRAHNDSYNSNVVVGVMSNPYDASTFVPVETVYTNNSTTYAHYSVFLANYTGPHGNIAVKAPQPATGYNYVYIDDIAIEAMPPCPPVQHVGVDHVTPSSADVSWIQAGHADSWTVLYRLSGLPEDSAQVEVTYNPTVTLTGLMPNTDYTVTIYASCGADYSGSSNVTFRTACDYIVSVPYTEDFDSVAGSTSTEVEVNNLPSCWRSHNIGVSPTYSGYPMVYNDSAYAYSGTNSVYFYSYTTAGTYSDQYAIMPLTDPDLLPLSSLELSFWMRSNTSANNSHVVVGVMTNPYDASTFVPVETIYSNSSTEYSYHSVLMGLYRGAHGHIAIMAPQPTSGYNYPHIDDVTIDYMPPCPRVGEITVTQTLPDSIGIAWFPLGTETHWLVSDGTNEYVTDDSSFVFGGLTPITQYTLSVRALCSSFSDTSEAVSVTVSTTCSDLAALPFTENFDSIAGITATNSSENNLPVCWGYVNHGTRTNYMGYPIVYSNGTYAYSGTNSLRYYSYHTAADSDQYVILPRTDSVLYPMNSLVLSFYMKGHSTDATYRAEAVVGVMSTPGDIRTFVPVDTVNSTGSVTYSRYEIPFRAYSGLHGNVAVMFPSPAGSGFNYNVGYVDDMVLEATSDCPPVVRVEAESIAANSAVISWYDSVSNSSWFVEYGLSGFAPGTGSYVNVYDTSVTLTGLLANTNYDVYVSPNCVTGVAGSMLFTFRTACGAIDSLPYFENFEGYPVGSNSIAPPDCGVPCYHRLDNASQYHFGYIGNPSSFPTGAHSGTGFLYYYMPTTAGTYADWIITVLPPVNTALHPVNTLQLSFWAKMNAASTSGDIVVGVMSDPLADSTFVPVDTVHVAGNVYSMKQAYLDRYAGAGAYIALRYTRDAGTATYYFVDDILLETIPACPVVSDITMAGFDTNMLSVTWTENGHATSWNVEYGVSGFTLGTGITAVATSLPYVITGLAPATDYDIYVSPVCPEGSTLRRMTTLRTANRYASLPFSCGFENTEQNALWTMENGVNTNKWFIGSGTNNGGTHSLYVSDNNGLANSYSNTSSTVDYAYIDLMIPASGDYSYSFDWKCYGESTHDFLRAALVPNTEMLTAGTSLPAGLTVNSMPESWISLDGGDRLNLQADWQTRSDVAHVSLPGVYRMVFLFTCDGSLGSMPPPAVDNITMVYTPCSRPDSIAISRLAPTYATLTWSETGSAAEWQYRLNGGSVNPVYATHVTLSGLSASTDYTVSVRSVCGSGDTSLWRTYSFRTPCAYITLPYTQDFESEATSSSSTGSAFVNCWTRHNNGTSSGGYPYVGGSTYNHTPGGSKGFYWYNSTSVGTYGDYLCAVMPPVDTTVDVSALQLSFWGKSSSAAVPPVLQIGVMTDPNNLSSFVGVDTVTVAGTQWRELHVLLSSYTGNGQYLAIKADRPGNSWGAYIDDITLDYAPTCIPPRHVFATNASTGSLTIDWVDITPAVEWQIEYGQHGFTRGSAAGTMLTVNAHPVTVYNLDSLTDYDFYIRPVCAAGDTAVWTDLPVATLNTGMCDHAIEFTIGSAGSGGTSYHAPVDNLYGYTLSEVIIESSEIGGPMDIEYIGYYYDYATAMTSKTNCTIYVQPTSRSSFGSAADVEALDPTSAVMVYTGALNCSHGWNFFPLDTVYSYDGSTNLMVIVDDNSGSYNSSSCVFRTEACTGNKVLYYYSDSQNADPWTVSSSYSGSKAVNTWRPVMKLLSCSAPYCHEPEITSVTNDYQSATVSWTGDGTNYEVNIKESTAADWPATDIALTGTSYTFNGLLPATGYTFRVRLNCGIDSLGYSQWVFGTFLTDERPCFPPDSLRVTAVTNATADFIWAVNGNENFWDIHVWYGSYDSTYRVNTRPVTLGGFTAGLTYNAAVRALCGTDLFEGDWSDTIQFTTAVCPDVTGLTVSNVTTNSITLNWDANPMAQGWTIEYGPTGFTQGQGTQVASNTNSYVVTGLSDGFTYDFYVKAVCGNDWTSENWVGTSATTQEGTVTCDAPTNVTADVNVNNVNLSWTPGEGNISFEIEYGDHGFSHGSGLVATTTATSHALTGLAYNTQYDVYVRGICDQNTYSDWSSVTTFTTGNVGIDTQLSIFNFQFSITPNPTSSTTTISVSGVNGMVRIAVVDMNGRTVATETLECSADCEKTMEVDNLPQGAYFVRITADNTNMVRKLIVR